MNNKPAVSKPSMNDRMFLRRAYNYIPKAVSTICQGFNIFGMVILGVLTVLTVVDVLGRTLFRKPILGTFELTEYMLVVIVFSTVAWCAVQKGHIKVDIVVSRLKPRAQIILSFLTHLISLGLLIIITWQCYLESVIMTNLGKTSAILNVPAYPFYWIMTAGFFILCIQISIELVQYGYKAVKS